MGFEMATRLPVVGVVRQPTPAQLQLPSFRHLPSMPCPRLKPSTRRASAARLKYGERRKTVPGMHDMFACYPSTAASISGPDKTCRAFIPPVVRLIVRLRQLCRPPRIGQLFSGPGDVVCADAEGY